MTKRIGWNKGLKSSEETRRRLSVSHMGYKMPEEQKRKIGDGIRGRRHTPDAIGRMRVAQGMRSEEWRRNIAKAKMGDKNPLFGKKGILAPQWRGGITPINAKIRNSPEMKIWRLGVFERDDFTCRGCGVRGGKLHAHHILSFSKFPEHRLELDNGITLCPPCHEKTDNYAGRTTNG
jgi:hypothetical protein